MRLWAILAVLITAAPQVVIPRVPPVITSVSPTSGAVADSITITGSSFGVRQENSVLSFNGIPASPSAWADTSITTPVPVGATSGSVTIRRGGQTSNGLAFTVASGSCSPSPCIAGVSGTVTNASAITVTGLGFGSTGPTVQIFDDFETGTNGSAIAGQSANVGTWKAGTTSQVPRYYNGDHVSGSQVMRVDTGVDDGMNNGTGLTVTGLSTLDIWWRAFVKIPTGDFTPGHGNAPNWKMFWTYNHCCDINDIAYPSTTDDGGNCGAGTTCNWQSFGNDNPVSTSGNDFWSPPCGSGGYSPCTGSGDWVMSHGKWYLITVYVHGDASDHATAVSAISTLSPDEPRALTLQYRTDHANFGHAATNTITEWVINGFTRNTTSGTSRPMFDDVYMATSPTSGAAQARVEIANNATYASSTNISMCTPTSWSATSISCTVRKGSLSNGTNYVWLTDASGNHIGPQPVTVS